MRSFRCLGPLFRFIADRETFSRLQGWCGKFSFVSDAQLCHRHISRRIKSLNKWQCQLPVVPTQTFNFSKHGKMVLAMIPLHFYSLWVVLICVSASQFTLSLSVLAHSLSVHICFYIQVQTDITKGHFGNNQPPWCPHCLTFFRVRSVNQCNLNKRVSRSIAEINYSRALTKDYSNRLHV